MPDELEVEVTGHTAVQSAINLLQSLDNDGGEQQIEISVKSLDRDSEDTVKKNHETTDESSEAEGDEREKGSIREGTSHHHALYAIQDLGGDENSVTGGDVIDYWDGYKSSSLRPALTKLWERKLVTRTKVETENPYYVYQLTDHGKEVLDEFGKPN